MYCPKCDRTIKKERLEQLNEDLKKRFGVDSLESMLCPVCSCRLIDISSKEGKK